MHKHLITVCEHTFYAPTQKKPVVLDLGANKGQFAKTMIELYDASVYGVEPTPSLHDSLGRIGFKGTLQAAASSTSGVASFRIAENSEESTLDTSTPDQNLSAIDVTTMTLPEIMQRFSLERIDILKMDVEGAELDVLEATPDEILADRIGQISIEFHVFSGLVQRRAVDSTLRRLRRLGLWTVDFSRTRFDVLVMNPRLLGIKPLSRFRYQHFERWKRLVSKKLGI